jgi:HEAT repeat protein
MTLALVPVAIWLALADAPAAAGALRAEAGAGGQVELWRGPERLGAAVLATPAQARGAPQLREHTVQGRRVLELRVPVKQRPRTEVWVGALEAGGLRPLLSQMVGARDADGETGSDVSVDPEGVWSYDTAARLVRCDGSRIRLNQRRLDLVTGRLLPAAPRLPAPAGAPAIVARRTGASSAMPAGRPRVKYPFASTSAPPLGSHTADARTLVAPVAVNDGDPDTVWAEGAPGDGRGEVLTARASGSGQAVVGLRLLPGDTRSHEQFLARARARALYIELGPAPEQRFEVLLHESEPLSPDGHRRPFWVPLPRPVPSSCVSVVVREVTPGADPRQREVAAWGDIDVYTDLDGPEGATRLVESLSRPDCESRVGDVAALGPEALGPLAATLQKVDGGARDCVLDALSRIDIVAARKVGAGVPALPEVLAALPRALLGASPAQEKQVTQLLRAMEAPATPALRALLGDEQLPAEDRSRAARALAALDEREVDEALLAAVGEGPVGLRSTVRELAGRRPKAAAAVRAALAATPAGAEPRRADLVYVLGVAIARAVAEQAGQEAAEGAAAAAEIAAAREQLTALTAAADQPFAVRARALEALGRFDDDQAVQILAQVRSSSDEPVLRRLAARGLGSSRRAGALPALRAAVDDQDPAVREIAVAGLARRGDRQSTGLIIAGAKQEPWPSVRRAEIAALGELCGQGATDLLKRAIERDVDDVRRAALGGLVSCRDSGAPQLLLAVLRRERETASLRTFAAGLLARVKDASTASGMVDALERLVVEAQADLALEATAVATLRALAQLDGPAAARAAHGLRSDPRPSLRRTAIETLARLCDEKATAALQEATHDPDAGVAAAAATGLRRCRSLSMGTITGSP